MYIINIMNLRIDSITQERSDGTTPAPAEVGKNTRNAAEKR